MKSARLLSWVAAVVVAFSAQARAAENADPGSSTAPVKVSPAVAEVARLAGSGAGEEVVLAYVKNSPAAFKLSADEILYLKDKGVSPTVIGAMLSHDPPPKPEGQPATPAADTTATAVERQVMKDPPPEVAYFYDALAPHGEWVQIDNFGWCWQPREAMDRSWHPYCDGGHWINTESGWFWESDYPWGTTAFHYGRWALNSRAGWVWAPDRTWGPAWVIWRTVDDLCGWAPLPPRSVFDARAGWRFNGLSVSATFDFGLRPEHYTFIPLRDFAQRDLAAHRVGVAEMARVFNRTTIINDYTFNNKKLVNQGIPSKHVSAAIHAPVPQATIYDLPLGWLAPPVPDGRPMVYRPELRDPLRPPRVEFQRVDERHPFIHHRPMGEGPGGPGAPGPRPGPGASPRPGAPSPSAPGKAPGGSPPGKKGPP